MQNHKPKLGILPIAKKIQYQGDLVKFMAYTRDRYQHDDSIDLSMLEEILTDNTKF
jgi:hypothetical protein